MFLFLKLCLSHLIADFILQFDELYRFKVKSRIGHAFHVGIHFLVAAFLVLPYLKFVSIWLFLIILNILHYFQDIIKYSVQRNPRKMFPAFVIDQIFHFLFMGAVFLLPVSSLKLGFPNHLLLNRIYSNDYLTVLFICFISVAFAGGYLLHTFRISYIPGSRKDHGITSYEMTHGILERTCVMIIFLYAINPLYMFLSPLIGVFRLFSGRLRNRLDFIFSFSYAAILSLLFRNGL